MALSHDDSTINIVICFVIIINYYYYYCRSTQPSIAALLLLFFYIPGSIDPRGLKTRSYYYYFFCFFDLVFNSHGMKKLRYAIQKSTKIKLE